MLCLAALRAMNPSEAIRQFTHQVSGVDEQMDLARAALFIAAGEYADLDIERELGLLDELARAAAPLLDNKTDPLFTVNTLSQYLFDEVQLRGNEHEYYDPQNSYLNHVLHRRLGIPISLSLVYIEVGQRLGIPLQGIGMPGHFLVRHRDVPDLFIDPFHGGILLSMDECAARLRAVSGYSGPWQSSFLTPIGSRDFIARMLQNLKAIYLQQHDHPKALRTTHYLVALLPDRLEQRRDRALLLYELGDYPNALEDLRAYLNWAEAVPYQDTLRQLHAELTQLVEG